MDRHDLIQAAQHLAAQCGFTESGVIDIRRLKFYPEVRRICEGNACRNYNTSWACPPAVGTLDECRARVEQYDCMLLFSRKYELEDSFDFEGITEGLRHFKRAVDAFDDGLRTPTDDFLLLSNEGCGRCARCTYPDAPCRFPDRLHHSLEGYGFIVSELAGAAGVRYNNGPGTVTYFGALLVKNGAQDEPQHPKEG